MLKEKYEAAELEVILFANEDIVTDSDGFGGGDDNMLPPVPIIPGG